MTPPRLPQGIPGIGVDLCAAARMEKSLQSPAFWRRVFAPAEQARLTALPGHRRAESAAADFAAKEAFLKAAGTGLSGFALAELAVLRRENGAPYFAFSGAAAAWMEQNALAARLSLTHEAGLACAFVVLEKSPRA